MSTIAIDYKKKLLQIVERDLIKQDIRLTSAEVTIKNLKEEQRTLLEELCELESNMECAEGPENISFVMDRIMDLKNLE